MNNMKHLMRYEGYTSRERVDDILDKISKRIKLSSKEEEFLGKYDNISDDDVWCYLEPYMLVNNISNLINNASDALEQKFNKQVDITILWKKILEIQMESGVPYLMFKDQVNKKNNQNKGSIDTVFIVDTSYAINNDWHHIKKAISNFAQQVDVDLSIIESVITANQGRIKKITKKILGIVQKNNIKNCKIAFMGLAFKANTDDIRYSPAIAIIEELLKNNQEIKTFSRLFGF